MAPVSRLGPAAAYYDLPGTPHPIHLVAIEHVVTDPERIEADLFAQAAHGGDFRPADLALDLGQLEADLERARGD